MYTPLSFLGRDSGSSCGDRRKWLEQPELKKGLRVQHIVNPESPCWSLLLLNTPKRGNCPWASFSASSLPLTFLLAQLQQVPSSSEEAEEGPAPQPFAHLGQRGSLFRRGVREREGVKHWLWGRGEVAGGRERRLGIWPPTDRA